MAYGPGPRPGGADRPDPGIPGAWAGFGGDPTLPGGIRGVPRLDFGTKLRLDHSFIPAIFTPAVDMRAAPTVAGLAALAALAPGALVSHAASPHAQFEAGVPLEEIKCGEGLVLLESPRGRPVCVTEGSAGRLVQRGFEEVVPVVTDRDVVVPGAEPDAAPGAGAPLDVVPGDGADTGPAGVVSRDTSPAGATDTTEKASGSEPVFLSGAESFADQAERLGLIPDERYEYAFKMPLEDPDAFAEKIMAAMDDRVIKKTHIRPGFWYDYDTERGKIKMHASGGIPVVLYEVGRTDPGDMDAFVERMTDGLGMAPDENEIDDSPFVNHKYDVPDPGYPVIDVNQKWKSGPDKGLEIFRHYVRFYFEPDRTSALIGSWIADSDKFDLYPFNQAMFAARDYLADYEELQKDDCNYLSSIVRAELDLLAERPVYEVVVGTCTVPHKTEVYDLGTGFGPQERNFYYDFVVYVDAVTGEPLFAFKRDSSGTWNWLHSRGTIP